MKRYLFMLLLPLLALGVAAQVNIEAPEPYAEVVDKNGEIDELSAGGDFSGEAPVILKLYSNAEEVEGFSLVCSWEFYKEGEAEPYLVRYDKDVEIELRESGATIIQPVIVYTAIANSEIVWEFGTETRDTASSTHCLNLVAFPHDSIRAFTSSL